MKKYIIPLILLILTRATYSQTTFFIVPVKSTGITKSQMGKVCTQIKQKLISTGKYKSVLSPEMEKRVVNQLLGEPGSKKTSWANDPKFYQLMTRLKIDQVIAVAVIYQGREYTIYIQIKDIKTRKMIFSKGYAFSSSFKKLLEKDTETVVEKIVPGTKPEKRKYFYCSTSGGLFYTEDFQTPFYGGGFGIGGKKWGQLSLEINLIGRDFSENINLIYETPKLWLIFLEIGTGFTSFRKQEFSFTDYYNSPATEELSSSSHSFGLRFGAGLAIPLFKKKLTLKPKIQSDIIYAEWEYLSGNIESDFIYSLYPACELNYLLYRNSKTK